MITCRILNKTREKGWKDYLSSFDTISRATENRLQKDQNYCVSVIFVKDNKIHQINRDYRNIDRVTDVITFAAMEGEEMDEFVDEIELGDIFINVDASRRQAEEYGHSLQREVCFLYTHGLLHCFGYDHMTEKDEKEMFGLQREILDPIISR